MPKVTPKTMNKSQLRLFQINFIRCFMCSLFLFNSEVTDAVPTVTANMRQFNSDSNAQRPLQLNTRKFCYTNMNFQRIRIIPCHSIQNRLFDVIEQFCSVNSRRAHCQRSRPNSRRRHTLFACWHCSATVRCRCCAILTAHFNHIVTKQFL